MKDLKFIKINKEDISDLQADARVIWLECYTDIISYEQIEYMLNWMYSKDTIEREIEHESINYYFICHNDIKLGFCSLGPYSCIAGRAKLHKLYLYPKFHGKGFGSTSLLKICSLAQEQGYDSICLNVNKNNLSAVKAYERNGFTKEKSIVNDIGNGYVMDDYVMLKDLNINS